MKRKHFSLTLITAAFLASSLAGCGGCNVNEDVLVSSSQPVEYPYVTEVPVITTAPTEIPVVTEMPIVELTEEPVITEVPVVTETPSSTVSTEPPIVDNNLSESLSQ